MSNTPKDVAQWMMDELNRVNCLYQETVVYQIKTEFGDEFVYINDNGNLAIGKNVLAAFRKLNDGDVIWERGEKMWRYKKGYDSAGRQQD